MHSLAGFVRAIAGFVKVTAQLLLLLAPPVREDKHVLLLLPSPLTSAQVHTHQADGCTSSRYLA